MGELKLMGELMSTWKLKPLSELKSMGKVEGHFVSDVTRENLSGALTTVSDEPVVFLTPAARKIQQVFTDFLRTKTKQVASLNQLTFSSKSIRSSLRRVSGGSSSLGQC